jgi:hypothetical protein
MVALEEQLSSKMGAENDVLHLRRQVTKLQCAATHERHKNKQLLIQINNLSMVATEKEVSHCIPCH